ncbi:MAG: VOC family protein [Pseudomonadota bacterium]|jgi:catechol 2,3-dioxygenase-like lactoylglutathione lyase family enzyme
MIDHISLAVSDLDRAVPLYEAMLAPLGLTKLVVRPASVGFGKSYPELWLNLRAGMTKLSPESGAHIGLRARTTAEIDAFHAAAVAAGATSESKPSLRPHDRVRYYAAFVADHDGNRIEAVTFPQT